MSEPLHPAASGPLPSFITAPGDTDALFILMAIILLVLSLMAGILFFRLHALPDRFAHQKVQFQIVCILGLIAMFTHMHIFWIAGLLLALVDIPDFSTPLNRIAGATEKIADRPRDEGERSPAPEGTEICNEAAEFRPPTKSSNERTGPQLH